MKTTLELPDDLMRTIKIRAVNEDRKLKDVVAELLRRGLAEEEARPSKIRHRMRFPLIEGTKPAKPGEDITHGRITEILAEDDLRYIQP
jgi:plasmid stability protein